MINVLNKGSIDDKDNTFIQKNSKIAGNIASKIYVKNPKAALNILHKINKESTGELYKIIVQNIDEIYLKHYKNNLNQNNIQKILDNLDKYSEQQKLTMENELKQAKIIGSDETLDKALIDKKIEEQTNLIINKSMKQKSIEIIMKFKEIIQKREKLLNNFIIDSKAQQNIAEAMSLTTSECKNQLEGLKKDIINKEDDFQTCNNDERKIKIIKSEQKLKDLLRVELKKNEILKKCNEVKVSIFGTEKDDVLDRMNKFICENIENSHLTDMIENSNFDDINEDDQGKFYSAFIHEIKSHYHEARIDQMKKLLKQYNPNDNSNTKKLTEVGLAISRMIGKREMHEWSKINLADAFTSIEDIKAAQSIRDKLTQDPCNQIKILAEELSTTKLKEVALKINNFSTEELENTIENDFTADRGNGLYILNEKKLSKDERIQLTSQLPPKVLWCLTQAPLGDVLSELANADDLVAASIGGRGGVSQKWNIRQDGNQYIIEFNKQEKIPMSMYISFFESAKQSSRVHHGSSYNIKMSVQNNEIVLLSADCKVVRYLDD